MVDDKGQNAQVEGGKFRQGRYELLACVMHFKELPCLFMPGTSIREHTVQVLCHHVALQLIN